jgi:hypothetical protein
MPVGAMFVDDVSSGWSRVQTVTIPGGTVSSSPPPVTSDDGNNQPQSSGQTQQPDVIFSNPFFLLGVGVLLGGVVVVVVMGVLRRYIKTPTFINDLPQTNAHTEPLTKLCRWRLTCHFKVLCVIRSVNSVFCF